jgi:hypothetical protein
MLKSESRLCQAAAQAAKADPELAGFDPISIITIITSVITALQGLFKNCGNTPTPANTQERVTQDYDPDTDTYGHREMAVAAREAKRSGRKNWTPVNYSQAQAMAKHSLDSIRLGETDVLQEAIDAEDG